MPDLRSQIPDRGLECRWAVRKCHETAATCVHLEWVNICLLYHFELTAKWRLLLLLLLLLAGPSGRAKLFVVCAPIMESWWPTGTTTPPVTAFKYFFGARWTERGLENCTFLSEDFFFSISECQYLIPNVHPLAFLLPFVLCAARGQLPPGLGWSDLATKTACGMQPQGHGCCQPGVRRGRRSWQ